MISKGFLMSEQGSKFGFPWCQNGAVRASLAGGSELRDLLALFESNLSPSELHTRLVQAACTVPGIDGVALYLSAARRRFEELELVAKAGVIDVPPPVTSRTKSGTLTAITQEQEAERFKYKKLAANGATSGWLGVHYRAALSAAADEYLQLIAFLAAAGHEQAVAAEMVRHACDKLEVLNELNKLVASGAPIEKMARSVAREAAFRFAAGCALTFLLSEHEDTLLLKGSYGCSPKCVPESLNVNDTQIGRALRLGGIMSLPNLAQRQGHGLDFLAAQGFSCVHWSSIEMKGEPLGVLLIGFPEEKELSDLQNDMLEEFARGVAVAIANAKNREKLAKYAGKLEELVQERTADLQIQTARADEANQAKSRFVANMSHELRTPLTAIVGYSSVLSEGIFGPINKEQNDALLAIAKAGEHLKELINDVLDVAKVEAGKEDPQPSAVEIWKLLEQIYKLMMQTAMSKGVQLDPLPKPKAGGEEELKAWCDARHLRQILINLASNAVKYTPTGGKVSVEVEKIGDKAKIVVADTGIGIPVEQQGKLFERFSRGEDSYTKTQLGTGIGLSLTRKLVEMNGGKIGVESEAGKGSRFWILVPLVATGADAHGAIDNTAEASSLTNTRLDGLNVLVVDDNHGTCEVLETIIKSVGGNVYIAYSAHDARIISENTSLDTALIDLAMPGESGLSLLDYFRKQADKPLSTMPLIVVSACVFETDREEAMAHGASAFVAKPFTPGKIVNTIRSLTTSAALSSL